MYAGIDKYGGATVAGYVAGGAQTSSIITVAESTETASAEETLCGQRVNPDGTKENVFLRASISPDGAGLAWSPEPTMEAEGRAIAMSQMSSMLRDDARVGKYATAVTAAVHRFIAVHGRQPLVLDIGSGTGLLALLAARAGAARVVGCELFAPLAAVAKEVVAANMETTREAADTGVARGGGIQIVGKKSTELTVGPGGDLPRRADIVISEILDSALLGEAVLPALRDTFDRLLAPGAAAVPEGALLWGQLVCSAAVRGCHDVSVMELAPGIAAARDRGARACAGGRAPLCLHADRLEDVRRLSEPFAVFDFDFTSPFPEGSCRSRTVIVPVTADGRADAVLCWWDLRLGAGAIYSTREGAEPLQDHWV
ncbi:unnamed protein product, partial [Phaeothamnion confervicola]